MGVRLEFLDGNYFDFQCCLLYLDMKTDFNFIGPLFTFIGPLFTTSSLWMMDFNVEVSLTSLRNL